MKITVWGDYACPFCYIGESMLEKVINELGIKTIKLSDKTGADNQLSIDFKAYELDPKAPVTPVQTMVQHFSSDHNISEEDAQKQMDRITKMAARNGLDYHMDGIKVCSTFDAHRLLKYAADNLEIENVLKLHFALFKANFTDNLQLSDHKVLQDIASTVGLDPDKVKEMLASDKYAEEVRKDEEEAEKQNLDFIPYLLFDNGEVLQGVLSPGAIKKALSPDN